MKAQGGRSTGWSQHRWLGGQGRITGSPGAVGALKGFSTERAGLIHSLEVHGNMDLEARR